MKGWICIIAFSDFIESASKGGSDVKIADVLLGKHEDIDWLSAWAEGKCRSDSLSVSCIFLLTFSAFQFINKNICMNNEHNEESKRPTINMRLDRLAGLMLNNICSICLSAALLKFEFELWLGLHNILIILFLRDSAINCLFVWVIILLMAYFVWQLHILL